MSAPAKRGGSESEGFERMVIPDDPSDRRLVENTHPPDWTNPTPDGHYNLVVIGAGTAGLVSAAGAAGLGAKVALVERALMGGDCLNVGCVPSKGIIRAARAVYDARDAARFGVRLASEPSADFAAAMERMRRLRADISPNDSAERFRKLGVDVFLGEGRFVGPNAVEVGGSRLEFSRAVIATGGRAAEPEIPGLMEAGYLTNETVFTLRELPRRLLVIGAGPIGCELAQSFRRFGSDVTLLTDGERVLPREDADAAEIVRAQLAREGLAILTRSRAVRAERRNGDTVVAVATDGREREMAFDRILVAVGRAPNVEGLGLETAVVRYSRHGVEVDDRLRTSNSRVYAAGDVCSRYKFTHAADAMARLVLRNAFFFGRGKASRLVIPWCTYTDPEIARVGFTEEEARAAGIDAASIAHEMRDVDRAILDGETDGFARVVYHRTKGTILGGTVVARHAGEMIGELTLAIATGQKIGALSTTIHPYPTQAEALKRVGDAYMRTRLTPTVKGLFERWFAWTR